MTGTEMLNSFNVLYNNITSNQAPGLNVFEVSTFLTKAQTQLLQEYFNPRTDVTNGGFDKSEKRQVDFSPLIVTERLTPMESESGYTRFDRRSVLFDMTKITGNMMFMLNETLENTVTRESVSSIISYVVIPLGYDAYEALMRKPYKYPQKRQAWRLVNNRAASVDPAVSAASVYEVITKDITPTTAEHAEYIIRYVRKPYPIIVASLTGGVTIESYSAPFSVGSACELPEEIQQEIIERAVTLAKIAWQGATATLVAEANRKQNNN